MERCAYELDTNQSTTAVSNLLYCRITWMGGSLRASALYYVILHCCSTGLWVGRSVRSCGVLRSCVHTGSCVIIFLFSLFLPLYRPCDDIVQRATSNDINQLQGTRV